MSRFQHRAGCAKTENLTLVQLINVHRLTFDDCATFTCTPLWALWPVRCVYSRTNFSDVIPFKAFRVSTINFALSTTNW
jgi:hypothetical protein